MAGKEKSAASLFEVSRTPGENEYGACPGWLARPVMAQPELRAGAEPKVGTPIPSGDRQSAIIRTYHKQLSVSSTC